MFYIASKVLWFLATPSNLLPILILAGLCLAPTRFGRLGRGLAWFALVLLLLVGFSPAGNWIILPLEERFPAFHEDGRPVDGIVVLGGVVLGEETRARGQLTLNDAAERFTTLADLARRYPTARIIFSGGAASLFEEGVAEADEVGRFAETVGIQAGRLLLENRSRTTAENATESRIVAAPRAGERWLLVTSAWHMPRAVGAFRQAGFPVVAYPVDYRTRGWRDARRAFGFASEGLRRFDLAAKEWAGLVAYRLAGRTDAVFPGPISPQVERGNVRR